MTDTSQGIGKYSFFNLADIIKYDFRRYNVGIGDVPSIYSRLKVNSSDSGASSNLWIAGLFGGTNNNLNKVALGTANSNAIISSINSFNNYSDLYINNDGVSRNGNVYMMGNLNISGNVRNNYNSIAKLDVNAIGTNNEIAYFSNSNLTLNKLVFGITNNTHPFVGAYDSNYNWTPMIINGNLTGTAGNDVIIGKSLKVNNNLELTNNIGIGTSATSDRVTINSGNIKLLNGSVMNIGTSGVNNQMYVYGSGSFLSNVGVGTTATMSESLIVNGGNIKFLNNSYASIGTSGINNSLNVYGFGYFSSNIGIGTFSSASSALSVSGNSYISGTLGIGTSGSANNLHVIGNGVVSGSLTANNFIGIGSGLTNIQGGQLTGTSSINASLLKLDSTFFSTNANNQLTYGGPTLASQWSSVNNSGSIYYTAGIGNTAVGIGINNPTGSLQVGTGTRLRVGFGTTDYTIIGTTETADNTSIQLNSFGYTTSGQGGGGSIVHKTYSDLGKHLFYCKDSIQMAITTNNIGIGTSSPSATYKLFVNGNLGISDGSFFYLGTTGTSSSLSLYGNQTIEGTSYFKGNIGIGTISSITDTVKFNTSSTMSFLDSSTINLGTVTGSNNKLNVWGSIGIGITASSVVGEKIIISSGKVILKNSGVLNIGDDNTGINRLNLYGTIGIGTDANSTNKLLMASGSALFQDNSTVGIGTTGTGNALNVYGTIFANGRTTLIGNVGIGVSSSLTDILTIGSGNITMTDTTKIVIGSSLTTANRMSLYGCLGIGTVIPDANSEKLMIASGTISFLNPANINVGQAGYVGAGSFFNLYGNIGIGTSASSVAGQLISAASGTSTFTNGSSINLGTSGTNNYLSIFGAVGIGTTASAVSTNKLYVVSGTSTFENGSTVNVGLTNSALTNLNVYGVSYFSGTTQLYGNVGIGRTPDTSDVKLGVVTGKVIFYGQSQVSIGSTNSETSNRLNVYGTVGIGTAASITDSEKLTIGTGTVIVQKGSTVNIGEASFTNSTLTVYGNVGVGTTGTNCLLNIYGNTTNEGTIYSKGNVGIGITPDASIKLKVVSGTTTFNDSSTVNIGTTIVGGTTNYLNVYGNVGIGTVALSTDKLRVVGGNINFLANSIFKIGEIGNVDSSLIVYGSVGIGTTGILCPLNVYGNQVIEGTSQFKGNVGIGTVPDGTNKLTINGGIVQLLNTTTLNIGVSGTTNILTLYGNANLNNSVGIGTTADVTNKLTVAAGNTLFKDQANVTIGDSAAVTVSKLNIFGNVGIGVSANSSSTNYLTIAAGTISIATGSVLNFGSVVDNTTKFNVNGISSLYSSVGIGTSADTTYKIKVVGGTNLFMDGTTLNIGSSTAGNPNSLRVYGIHTNDGYSHLLGNVGIGMTASSSNGVVLSVSTGIINYSDSSTFNIGTSVGFLSNPSTVNMYSRVGIGTAADGTFIFKVQNNSYFVGKVGIGTTTLSTYLNVVGGITADNITVSGTISGALSGSTVLSASSITSGTLPIARGGTNSSSFGTNAAILYYNNNNSAIETIPSFTYTPAIGNSSAYLTAGTFVASYLQGDGSAITNIKTNNIIYGTAPISVALGGTGNSTFGANLILYGNTTSAIQTASTFSYDNTVSISNGSQNTIGKLSVNNIESAGKIKAVLFEGSGASLTNIPAANITGTNTLPSTAINYNTTYFEIVSNQLSFKQSLLTSSAWQTLSASSLYYNGSVVVNKTTSTGSGAIFQVTGNTSIFSGRLGVNNDFDANHYLYVNGKSYLNGSVGIGGAANDSFPLYVNGNTYLNGSVCVGVSSVDATYPVYINQKVRVTANTKFEQFVGISIDPSTKYKLYVGGDIASTGNIGVVLVSDKRLKTNIKTVDDALEKIKKCRGVYYNRINSDENQRLIGVIAQEIEEILPEVVVQNDDGFKSVGYNSIIGVLIEAIKDLDDKYNSLEERIKNLEKI